MIKENEKRKTKAKSHLVSLGSTVLEEESQEGEKEEEGGGEVTRLRYGSL